MSGLRVTEGSGPLVDMRLVDGIYRQKVETHIGDGSQIDAFARLRVSTPTLLIDTKRVGGVPDSFMTNAVTGSGAVSYTAARASTALTIGPAAGSVIRQTKARGIYQPAKSMLAFQTFICAPLQAGVVQSIGYFDHNNGIFLKVNGLTPNFSRRSYVSGAAIDVDVPQSEWNLDKLDGTGASGITIDCAKPQILVADFEWLGVGRVRIGFVVDGLPVYAHEFLNANADLTAVYMSNPNLPLRWEISAAAAITGTATLEAICGSLASEGGYDLTGLTASADAGTTGNAIASGATEEILAVRLQAGFTEFATAFIQSLTAINTTSGAFRYQLVLNPTETAAGTWTAVPGSVMEANSTRTITPGTGTVIASGFVTADSSSINLDARPVLTSGTTLAGVTDVYSLVITNLSVQSETFFGSLTWREAY